MSNLLFALPMLRSSLLIDENTPIASSTDHSTTDAVTNTMPSATDSRNDSFSTDHGSTRATVRRTLRGPVAAVLPVEGPARRGGSEEPTRGPGLAPLPRLPLPAPLPGGRG